MINKSNDDKMEAKCNCMIYKSGKYCEFGILFKISFIIKLNLIFFSR